MVNTRNSVVLFGLPNMGNTCYLNSAVQLLLRNPKFKYIEDIYQNPKEGIYKIKKQLEKLSPRFKGSKQHDSGEALVLLLEHYSSKSQLNNLKDYEFTERTRIRCKLMNCLNEEITKNKTSVLFLDITESLDKSYRLLKNSVILEDDNSWKCPKCNMDIKASKRCYYEDWSKYLIIGLKRFIPRGFGYVKNNNFIDIPLNWRHNYYLKAAIIHSGSMNGGHYVCVGKENNKWFLFNDSSVSEIPNKDVLNNYLKQAYFLLYEYN